MFKILFKLIKYEKEVVFYENLMSFKELFKM